jgi:AmmeMemoRadiSam system protein A
MANPYVALAALTIRTFVDSGKIIPIDKVKKTLDLPEEMLSKKAGAFVTLHADGALRGCIGTIEPQTDSIAEEILRNAILSASEDPRFPPVRAGELDMLDISVDVLRPKELCTFDELDPHRYGVIVSSGFRRGLLLPRLDGIDSAKEQVSIALQKAGISPNEPYRIERFEVVRHE